jgi:hypothetical protein
MTINASLPILYDANISPYVRKVRVAFACKGIEPSNNPQMSQLGKLTVHELAAG